MSVHPSICLSTVGVTQPSPAGGGYPTCLGGGGYPSQVQPRGGGSPARSGREGGFPQPGGACSGVPPSNQVRMGGACPWVPPGQVRMGGWGGYPGYPPGTGQHMEYLISGGRYASCVHAGGLSCINHWLCNAYIDVGTIFRFLRHPIFSHHLILETKFVDRDFILPGKIL